jgi:hypothetical protein
MLRKKILRSLMMMMMMMKRLFSLCLPRDSLTTKLLVLSHSSRFPSSTLAGDGYQQHPVVIRSSIESLEGIYRV